MPLTHRLRPELAELKSYVPTSHAGIEVRLDANEAPKSVGDAVRPFVETALRHVPLERYPDARATVLREHVARRTGAKPDELIFGSGSDEVISFLCTAFARSENDAILIPAPTFVMYRMCARAHGMAVREVPLDDAWDLDVDAMSRALTDGAVSLVFLARPNNPTGNVFSRDRVEHVIERAKDALVVIDEAYVDYASGGSLRGLRANHPNVAIVRTLSKVGLAALRVGWLEADAALVAEIDKVRQPFNVSATSQAAAAAVLDAGYGALEEAVFAVREERDRLARELRAMGLAVTPSEANFLWITTPGDAAKVYEGLASRGVLVRSFHAAGSRTARQLRVTAGTRAEGDRFLEALRACIS